MALFGKKKKPMNDIPDMSMNSDPYAQDPNNQGYYQQPQDQQQPMPPDMNQQPLSPDMGAQEAPAPEPGFGYEQAPYEEPGDIKERVEEVAEAIIDEKWNELMRDINKVIEWKEKTDTEIKKIQQDIEHLKERFESLHKGILGKITEYDENLTNVGSEIKAMEMAFQKILPTFTENVNKLDRLVKGKK